MPVDPTGGIATSIVVLGVVAGFVAYMWISRKKSRNTLYALAAAGILVGGAFGGLALVGVGAFVAVPGAPLSVSNPPPLASGIYDAVITSSTALTIKGGQTAPTQYITPNSKAVTQYAPNALWVGASSISYVYTLSLVSTVINLNTGLNTQTYSYAASIVSVPTILSTQGVPSPAANFTADQSRYAVTWTMSGTGAPSGYQTGATWTTSGFATGASGTLTMSLPLATGVLVNFPKTAAISFSFLEGGVALTDTMYNTG